MIFFKGRKTGKPSNQASNYYFATQLKEKRLQWIELEEVWVEKIRCELLSEKMVASVASYHIEWNQSILFYSSFRINKMKQMKTSTKTKENKRKTHKPNELDNHRLCVGWTAENTINLIKSRISSFHFISNEREKEKKSKTLNAFLMLISIQRSLSSSTILTHNKYTCQSVFHHNNLSLSTQRSWRW